MDSTYTWQDVFRRLKELPSYSTRDAKEIRKLAKKLAGIHQAGEKAEKARYKPKRFIARGISVDAGVIVIADKQWFADKRGNRSQDRPDLWKEFDVEKGAYQVDWAIPDCWNGSVKGEGRLSIKSGKMIVTDPCYLIGDEQWSTLLTETEYLRLAPLGVVVLDKHGGDGCFTVNIKVQRVSE